MNYKKPFGPATYDLYVNNELVKYNHFDDQCASEFEWVTHRLPIANLFVSRIFVFIIDILGCRWKIIKKNY